MIEILKNMTIGSWLTAGVIVLLRLIFRGGISPRAKYLLWLMLTVRLMVPVLPESDFGILDRPDTVIVAENSNYNMYMIWDDIVQRAPVESSVSIKTSDFAETDTYSPGIVQTQQPEKRALNPVVIWALGVVICLGVYLILKIKTALWLRKAVCVDDPEALRCYIWARRLLGVKREIRFCYGAESLIGGLIKPVLLIPRELSGEKLEAALIHELMHYRSGDLWIAALQRILCCIHWYNPVVWICFYWARQDCEKACDQRVMELNTVSPAVYAELLLQETMLKRRTQIGTTSFGSGNIKQRIRAIANYRRPAFYLTVLAVVVILFAAFFTLTARANGPWRWTKELTLSDITHVTITCAGQQQTLGDEETEKLLLTINALDKRDFEENETLTGTTPDTSIAITCGDLEYCINLADGPYGQFEISYGGKQWWIQSEALNEKVSDILSVVFREDLSPAMYPLSILLNVPEESIMNGLASITAEKSFDKVNSALDALLGQYITDDFKSYFSGGTGIGDLWTGAMRYGYSSFCRELKVTVDESDQTNFQYEATLDITLQNGQIHTVSISGVVRCNQNYRVTSISIDNGVLRELHAVLDETVDETTVSNKPMLQEIKETLYSDCHLGGDFYQAENCTLKEFLSAVPNADSLTLSTGDVIWRVPRDKCASAANEIGVGFEILTDNEAEYGYFYLTDDASFEILAEQMGLLVQQEEGTVSTKLEAISKYSDGVIWATVFFEKYDSRNEGIYLFELSDSDFSVLSIFASTGGMEE